MTLENERLDTLRAAAEQRARDVMIYQVNIDNYTLALAEIERSYAGDAEMQAFAEQLRQGLADNIREQKKEQIMLRVITQQLETGNVG